MDLRWGNEALRGTGTGPRTHSKAYKKLDPGPRPRFETLLPVCSPGAPPQGSSQIQPRLGSSCLLSGWLETPFPRNCSSEVSSPPPRVLQQWPPRTTPSSSSPSRLFSPSCSLLPRDLSEWLSFHSSLNMVVPRALTWACTPFSCRPLPGGVTMLMTPTSPPLAQPLSLFHPPPACYPEGPTQSIPRLLRC